MNRMTPGSRSSASPRQKHLGSSHHHPRRRDPIVSPPVGEHHAAIRLLARSLTREPAQVECVVRVTDDRRMRTVYHQRLSALSDQLVLMCRMAGDAVTAAARALDTADPTAIGEAFAADRQVTAMREPCEAAAVALLAQQAPVAGELRQVVSAIQLVADLTRMSSLAHHIATTVHRRHPEPVTTTGAAPVLARMGNLATELVAAAAAILASHDPDRAGQLDRDDDEMDALHRELFTIMLAPDWHGRIDEAVDIALLGRYYERIGDHAVAVGRRILYIATGTHEHDPCERDIDAPTQANPSTHDH